MKCEKCATAVSSEESFQHAGQTLCEDCYMDVMTAPKACDPWAVYSATKVPASTDNLSLVQQQILDLIKAKGPLTVEEVCSHISITEDDFHRNFATLRHMELARGFKKGDRVFFTLFHDEEP